MVNGGSGPGESTTLSDVSASSLTTPNSLYTMTSGIPVEFQTSTGTRLLYLDEINGRVGIGTNTPDNMLNVSRSNGGGDVGIVIQNNAITTGETASLYFRTTTSTTNFGTIQSNRLAGGGADMIITPTNTSNTALTVPLMTLHPISSTFAGLGINNTTPVGVLDVTMPSQAQGAYFRRTATQYILIGSDAGGHIIASNNTAANEKSFSIFNTSTAATATFGIGTNSIQRLIIGVTGTITAGGGAPSGLNEFEIGDTVFAGSGSLAGSALNIAQTWNTTGTPTAIKLNVTNTASTGAPLLMDLQVGSSSKFNVDINGAVTAGNGVTLNQSNAGNISIPSASIYRFASRVNLSAPGVSQFNILDNANSTGIGFDVSTDGTLKIRTRAQTGDGSLTALNLGLSGIATRYNNILTVSNGIPSELATVDLTAQAAAITATTLYTPAATGMYRISAYLQLTTPGTTSVLGGATGLVLTYNDGDGNVAQSDTVSLMAQNGSIVNFINTNTTGTNLNGSVVIYARTGVAIQYAIGYTSAGTAMQYAVHLKVEALG